MKIGAIVICRYNSSRLPGKILKQINGKILLSYIIERLKEAEGIDEIIIATSDQETDNPIEKYCMDSGLKYFRGDLNNVAKRFLDCALQFELDYAIRVNGDNLFLDKRIMSEMINITRNGFYDLITNVKDRTFPKGVSVEILNTNFYNQSYINFNSAYYKEHVTIYFYENEDSGSFYYYQNETCKDAAGIQLAIDTPEDFNNAEKILKSFSKDHTNYGFEDVYQTLLDIKSHS